MIRLHGQYCSPATVPALLYDTPSLALCNICIAYKDVGKGREQERKLSPPSCGLCRRYDPMNAEVESCLEQRREFVGANLKGYKANKFAPTTQAYHPYLFYPDKRM